MTLEIPSAIKGKPGFGVAEQVFGCAFNESLVHQIIVSYLAGARSGTKGQKTRSDVSGGGAKPWKQKGSGRARAGTTRSPIWRSGGVTFAARNRNYEQKVNKKMYRAAIRSMLSELLRQNRIAVIDEITLAAPKTKDLLGRLKKIGFESGLILTEELDFNLYISARNIPNITVGDVRSITPLDLVQNDNILVTPQAISRIQENLT